ncbi:MULTISPECIES: DUF4184 family protein [unclassified Gilliamella]|uniref:DUF4184 family protein n=1 Tax=unclassified Gilliamella TaxID=2685620 RepID=UPI003A5D0374
MLYAFYFCTSYNCFIFLQKASIFSMITLIIGSMSPDFEYFLRIKIKSDMSHTLIRYFLF